MRMPNQLKKPLRKLKSSIVLRLAPDKLQKTDLIHILSRKLGLRNYLEICTTTTGNLYRNIDRRRFVHHGA